ncbi:MAG: class I SAM-dependent methyltransferase [Desulfuromonadaceae bacterium]
MCDKQAFLVFEDSRPFYICCNCGLIFTECSLSRAQKNEHYQSQHANPFDWLKEAEALLRLVSFAVVPRKIFDFGSGSGFLAAAFKSLGYEVTTYEPLLHGEFKRNNYNCSNDLVILNQVIEHVEDIDSLVDNVYSVTEPGGIIFVATLMTDAITDELSRFQEQFKKWWYKDDQTHISFFSQCTFEYICANKDSNQLKLVYFHPNYVLLQRMY